MPNPKASPGLVLPSFLKFRRNLNILLPRRLRPASSAPVAPASGSAVRFPPRGSSSGSDDAPPSATWANPSDLGPGWEWRPGKILLGEWQGRLIGDPDQKAVGRDGDDRNLCTFAGSRAGKTRTILIPNLLRYSGSAVVIDPKGELARATARHRQDQLGQVVAVIDPFGVSGLVSASFNPLADLDPDSDTFIDDVGAVADALIVDLEKDPHWTDSAKTVIILVILYMFASEGPRTLVRLRHILLGAEGYLSGRPDGDEDRDLFLFYRLSLMDAYDGLMGVMARSFVDKGDRELGSVLSTAREQTRFLDSRPLARTLQDSTISLRDLKRRGITIYLCLPAGRLATHFRWLRLVITLALLELERDPTVPEHAVLLMLEEFAALQHMRPIERAAGFMAGFGVRMWSVLQDINQLKAIYPKSWETFIGNAGVIQAFGNVDLATTEHLSKMLGTTQLVQINKVWTSASAMSAGDTGLRENIRDVPLLAPNEVAAGFARETNRQLILVPGRPPIYLNKVS